MCGRSQRLPKPSCGADCAAGPSCICELQQKFQKVSEFSIENAEIMENCPGKNDDFVVKNGHLLLHLEVSAPYLMGARSVGLGRVVVSFTIKNQDSSIENEGSSMILQ